MYNAITRPRMARLDDIRTSWLAPVMNHRQPMPAKNIMASTELRHSTTWGVLRPRRY
ncbi:hypothetical protein [Arthrobacter sp. CAN_A1]|uniref:hypothetical protein n=1 Tax=Arthrobacter sp. CAN_A1 TaxID=2787717 RepID=UPI001A231C1E